jgi:uncharacterized membrane protein YjjB (DUF3815 family)
MSALLTLLWLGFGAAIGTRIGQAFAAPGVGAPQTALPQWTTLIALLIAPIAFMVLFRARPRDGFVIAAAGWLAFWGGRWGAQLANDPAIGAAIGAFVVGMFSNVYGRVMSRPTSVPLVPGLMLLVPGSLGFRSVAQLAGREKDVLTSIDSAFTMAFVAIALVAGLLLTRVIVPPRKIL